MRILAVLFGFSLALVMHLIAAMPVHVPVQAAEAAPAGPQGAEKQLFDLLNEDRKRKGLRPLEWDDRLAEAAEKHSQLMAQQGKLSHDFPGEPTLRQRLSAVPLERSGENVAQDHGVEVAHEGFMGSPPHRANILSRGYDAVGIAVVPGGDSLWVTEDFAQRISELSERVAEDKVATAFAQRRMESGAPPLQRASLDGPRILACSMAKQDRLNTSSALNMPGARYAVAYTSTDPDELSGDLQRLTTVQGVSRYAIGVCFARSAKYPSGVYWVVAVLYGNER